MKTKDKIVDSLCELMKTKDYESIEITEIAQLAEINRSTYYRNFKSKEDILEYKITQVLDEYIEEFDKNNDKSKENYIKIILKTFLKHKNFFKTIYKQNKTYIIQKSLTKYFKVNVNHDNIEELYSNYYHIGGIYNFIICWIEQDMDDNIELLSQIGAKITKNTPSLYNIS